MWAFRQLTVVTNSQAPYGLALSIGNGQEVDVVFRPTSSEVYDDVILFKVLDGPNAGGFNVPVRALLPTLQVGR